MLDIILGSFGYVKGGSLNLSHSQGLEGYLGAGSEGAMVGTYIRLVENGLQQGFESEKMIIPL